VSVHARVTVPLRLDELESHFKRGGDENDVVADLMARDRIVVGRRERGRGTGITLRDPQPSQPRRIESDLTKVLERRTSGPPTGPPNLSFMDACLLNVHLASSVLTQLLIVLQMHYRCLVRTPLKNRISLAVNPFKTNRIAV